MKKRQLMIFAIILSGGISFLTGISADEKDEEWVRRQPCLISTRTHQALLRLQYLRETITPVCEQISKSRDQEEKAACSICLEDLALGQKYMEMIKDVEMLKHFLRLARFPDAKKKLEDALKQKEENIFEFERSRKYLFSREYEQKTNDALVKIALWSASQEKIARRKV